MTERKGKERGREGDMLCAVLIRPRGCSQDVETLCASSPELINAHPCTLTHTVTHKHSHTRKNPVQLFSPDTHVKDFTQITALYT